MNKFEFVTIAGARAKQLQAGCTPKVEGSEKKAQWIEVGALWSQSDGSGFDLVIPPGISLAGRIVCRQRKEQSAG